jgi:hypothetical protein
MPKIIAAGGNPAIFDDDTKFLEYTGEGAVHIMFSKCTAFYRLRQTGSVVVQDAGT